MNRRQFLMATSASMAAASLPLYASSNHDTFRIVALVFDDYETLDLHGPIEMLGHMKGVNIELVGSRSIIRSYQGPKVVADLDTNQVHHCDLFIIPGGMGTRALVKDEVFLEWMTRQCHVSNKVFSVCTGSALLASTPLLEGYKATSNKQAFEWVRSLNHKVQWQTRARWVDDRQFITSSGVSAGTDAALALISQYRGRAEADRIATLAEYQWNDDPNNDPFAIDA
ncbi:MULTISPECIES: DJ-1/PfpI family protein [Ferrimonas]|uniref:DJ-1/PfpI family protein n=1 Tax=Ferrimonas TaxID=44011 RepID=UPI00041882CA|nr:MULTISPECIES: DJ-1/PfpI family protein [Ferrimonas]USD37991.1 DJ-1/PfpI family protein [Ferrimonas sp. SCSIO 43195]